MQTGQGTPITTDAVLDNSMMVREMRGGTAYATYLNGPRGPEYRRDDTTGAVKWYVYDGLGSVVGEIDPAGNMTATRYHDVYGLVRSPTGNRTSAHGFVGSLGHISEDNTGLIYMRARYMDPALGRFVSEDPAGDSDNWYVYCNNEPVNRYDKTGEKSALIDIGGGWWIHIDDPEPGILPNERDLHWGYGNRKNDLGSIFENGEWKHFRGNQPTNRVKKAATKAGWTGFLALECCSVVAYFKQNPLDTIAIMLDCNGEFDMANRVDALNNCL